VVCPGFHRERDLPTGGAWLGTHEKALPDGVRHHEFGNICAIYFEKPGGMAKVRGWTSLEGPYHGFLITHNEQIGISDYYTIEGMDGASVYGPTSS
jgi:homospermidine synthase